MAKIIGDGPVPKKIPGFTHYLLPDVAERVIRLESGITKENFVHERYDTSRENASEFGRLTALCKSFREPLDGVFPVTNRRDLCNRFTSKMRLILQFDVLHANGNRRLDVALSFLEAREELAGYEFNLLSPLPYLSRPFISFLSSGSLSLEAASFVSELHFPVGSKWVSVRMHRYLFDFSHGQGVLSSSVPLFLNRFTAVENVVLDCTIDSLKTGTLFTFLELKFYAFRKGSFVSLVPDCGTVVCVLNCEL